MQAHIVTHKGTYLAPGKGGGPAGSFGYVVARKEPFVWTISPKHVYAPGLHWDTYDAGLDKVVLWPRKSEKANQHFAYVDGTIQHVPTGRSVRVRGRGVTLDNAGTPVTLESPVITISDSEDEEEHGAGAAAAASHPFALAAALDGPGGGAAAAAAPVAAPVATPGFRFVSYNILVPWTESDMQESEHHQAQKKYSEWYHKSGHRRGLVTAAIRQADVAVMVEVEKPIAQQILTPEWDFEFCKKYWDDDPDGSVVAWRRALFKRAPGKATLCARLGVDDGNQVVLAVQLVCRHTGANVVVAAAHLKSGEQAHQEKRRAREAEALLARLRGHFGSGVPVVVAGDLNSHYRRDGYHPYTPQVAPMFTKHGYRDAHAGYDNTGGNGYITYNYWQPSRFDYVYLKGGIRASKQFVPQPHGYTPNAHQGSDHLPIYATLRLTGGVAAAAVAGGAVAAGAAAAGTERRVVTFNLGFGIQADRIGGSSEDAQTSRCHEKYGKGKLDTGLPRCTQNAAQWLRELHPHVALIQESGKVTRAVAAVMGPDYRVQQDGASAVIYRLPGAVPLTVNHTDKRVRSVAGVYHQGIVYLSVWLGHLHDFAAHKAALASLATPLREALYGVAAPRRLIVGMDSNDYQGTMVPAGKLPPGYSYGDGTGGDKAITIGKFRLRFPGNAEQTCCTDSEYAYVGDYVLDSDVSGAQAYGMRLPVNPDTGAVYTAQDQYMSDHAPVVYDTRV